MLDQRPPSELDYGAIARALCERSGPIGADGLLVVLAGEAGETVAAMRIYNADGTEAEMCGNGIRCVAKYVYDHGLVRKPTLRIETGRGVLSLDLELSGGKVQLVRVDMGEPILKSELIPTKLPGDPPRDIDHAEEVRVEPRDT